MHTLSVTLVGLFFSLTNPQKGEWPQKNTKSSSICFISVCVCGSIPVMLDFFFRVSMPFVFLMCSRHLWFWMQRLTTVPGNSFGGLLPGNASARYMRVVNPRATLVLFAFTFELFIIVLLYFSGGSIDCSTISQKGGICYYPGCNLGGCRRTQRR